MFDGRKWQPIVSLGTVSQLLEGCAKANESVQRGGPNISGGQRTARVEIWFGRSEPRQTKDAANTGTGQVQSDSRYMSCRQHHKLASQIKKYTWPWLHVACFFKIECIFFPKVARLQRQCLSCHAQSTELPSSINRNSFQPFQVLL